MRDVRVALWQTPVPDGPPGCLLPALRSRLDAAADAGADLLVAPELALAGRPAAPIDLEGASAPWWDDVTDAVREHGVWLATSFLRREGAALRNTFTLLDDRGRVVGRQDKIHLWAQEAAKVQPGQEVAPIATPWGALGGLVCYDVQFPEIAREAALRGAEWFVVPAAFYSATGWDISTRARALENGCFVVAANRVGRDADGPHNGGSRALDPLGTTLAQADAANEALLVVDLEARLVPEARAYAPFLRDLRWPRTTTRMA